MRASARSIDGRGLRGREARFRTLAAKYQLAPPSPRVQARWGRPAPAAAGRQGSAGETALRRTLELERQQVVGELASTVAHEMNNVLHAMALRLASLRGQACGELSG